MRETQLAKHFETLMCRLQSLIPIFYAAQRYIYSYI